ncbi:hypothetical protein CDD82_7089 [Ophiocordyceps australis]|uniref:Class E vacuolar protein-sorting machinery protein HSE1 n=1 Tax=Ophiocordyceps australis TaxID=1399860 RepID=A0A2C5YS80_9HYPO|nr:hypothetical protein CDD82_7089 [Ophiocordyceps australis]
MEVCDKVSGDANGPKEAVQSMMKRLAHRNANVQLYTLELAHALCQNCGKPMHREVSSRAFTDALLKLANDRNTHTQVKAKILEKVKDWSDMFSDDADLGIMDDAYHRLKQSNPTLQPPSAPQKQGLTASDRQKEEDELQMALKLSLQEEDRKKNAVAPATATANASAGEPSRAADGAVAGTTAATVSRVRALYDFSPSEPGELEFRRGDVIAVLESVYKDWWRGSLKGRTGIFPLNYVDKLTDPTPDELQREAQIEAEVFAEIKNVEKLLTLLSASNTAPREEDNEEISVGRPLRHFALALTGQQKLYHQTLAIRPKLIKLIEKYSQKKGSAAACPSRAARHTDTRLDDFTQLNEKFIKARRDYEALLESSMSHPPQHNYQQYALRPAFYSSTGPGEPYQTSSPRPVHQQSAPGSAPFYVAGTEVPTQQQQHLADQATTSPQQQAPYGHHRPQSTYGAQELATSVYDSPMAPTSAPARVASPPPTNQYGAAYQGRPQPEHQQYKPYVPPSAPGPDDYYR